MRSDADIDAGDGDPSRYAGQPRVDVARAPAGANRLDPTALPFAHGYLGRAAAGEPIGEQGVGGAGAYGDDGPPGTRAAGRLPGVGIPGQPPPPPPVPPPGGENPRYGAPAGPGPAAPGGPPHSRYPPSRDAFGQAPAAPGGHNGFGTPGAFEASNGFDASHGRG